jgi:uncharacterized membrane protein YhaH (DUF805 family)
VRGEVLTYDDASGTGLISGDDGARYSFTRADLQQLTPVSAGAKVDFVVIDGAAAQVFLIAPAQASTTAQPLSGGGINARIDWRTLFFDATGRIGQRDYWIGIAALFVVNLVLGWLPLVGTIVSLVAIYAGVCVSSKRLHDMGRSGWLAAIPFGVTLAATVMSAISVAGMMGAAAYDNGLGMAAGLGTLAILWPLAFLINLGFVIWLGITAGQPDDNLYGPPPAPLANF